ncbi:MAG: response regulator, partial [Candidatus Omnitrophota bacterium]
MPKHRIIVIDDDSDIRDVLALTLAQEDYEVLQAQDGAEGLNLIKDKAPDLVIVDYNMPKINGPTLCGIVKKDILMSHLPIIMLTGKG